MESLSYLWRWFFAVLLRVWVSLHTLNEQQILSILFRVNAVLTNDHFVYTTGLHGSTYVNKDALYPHTRETELLCREIAHRCMHYHVDVVVGPALGAIILAHEVARHLTKLTNREVLYACAEKSEDGFVIKRGYDKSVHGKRILLVEDILTTGGSASKATQAVGDKGGNVIAVAALCNRGGVTAQQLGYTPELVVLTTLAMPTWTESECPLCAQDIPVNTEIGKGREFLLRSRG